LETPNSCVLSSNLILTLAICQRQADFLDHQKSCPFGKRV